jgi:D-glycero-beta-D-manno-heptose 1-phosphate adenylyltransferase
MAGVSTGRAFTAADSHQGALARNGLRRHIDARQPWSSAGVVVTVGEVLGRDDLARRVADDRTKGLTHAFANGCFDLLHVGHVRYLQASAAEADRLIVALNDDASVGLLKGPNRPIMPAADRAELVAAVSGVDYVVIFSEPTVTPLLELLRPDVHCKGTDYQVETVPERQTVRAYGGRIAIVGDPKDHSTHDLLSRIRRAAVRGEGGQIDG